MALQRMTSLCILKINFLCLSHSFNKESFGKSTYYAQGAKKSANNLKKGPFETENQNSNLQPPISICMTINSRWWRRVSLLPNAISDSSLLLHGLCWVSLTEHMNQHGWRSNVVRWTCVIAWISSRCVGHGQRGTSGVCRYANSSTDVVVYHAFVVVPKTFMGYLNLYITYHEFFANIIFLFWWKFYHIKIYIEYVQFIAISIS